MCIYNYIYMLTPTKGCYSRDTHAEDPHFIETGLASEAANDEPEPEETFREGGLLALRVQVPQYKGPEDPYVVPC